MKKASFLLVVILVVSTGCSLFEKEASKVPVTTNNTLKATANVIGSKNEGYGTASFEEQDKGVLLTLDLKGLPAGTHGIHIHEVAKCEPPNFESAGAHFNPTKKQHGKLNPKGYHLGDLPNIEVGSDGIVELSFVAEGLTLKKGRGNTIMDDDGSALVIHQSQDDYLTDPSGNSGNRIACGVIINGK
ncbi:MAG: superoxide dismutase family protein [Lysinibacillus sp.]